MKYVYEVDNGRVIRYEFVKETEKTFTVSFKSGNCTRILKKRTNTSWHLGHVMRDSIATLDRDEAYNLLLKHHEGFEKYIADVREDWDKRLSDGLSELSADD